MFFDLSFRKILALFVIVPTLAVLIASFVFADNIWNILPEAGYEIARQESGFWYWLRYKLPSGSAASYEMTATTQDGHALSIPVLLYHGESGGPDMPTSVFVDQMRALKAAGWQTITMQQFDEWERGEIQLPAKSFLLTFDDGRTDTFYPVDPVLQDLGYHAVMFVITGLSLPENGKPISFYLNKTDLQNMIASGRWDLESHGSLDHSLYAVQSTTDLSQTASTTQGHFISNKFWDSTTNTFETDAQFTARVTNDLKNSKQILEQDFGINVIAYAYPFNDYGEDSVNFPGSQAILNSVVPSVYTYAFYQTWAGNGDKLNYPEASNAPPGQGPYMIKRIEPQNSWSGQDLVNALDAASAKSVPYQSSSFGQEWVGTWGDVSSGGDGVSLAATPTTSGASAFLDGSDWWRNYYFSAVVDWEAGIGVSLLARSDGENFLACAFSQTNVVLERHFGGSHIAIASTATPFSGDRSAARLGIGVQGDVATCYENGIAVVSGVSDNPAVQSGGVGVEVWDPTLGLAKSVVKSVLVETAAPAAVLPAQHDAASQLAQTDPLPPNNPPTPPQQTSATTTTDATSSDRASSRGFLLLALRQFMNSLHPRHDQGG